MEYRHTSCMEIRNTRHGNKECLWMVAYLKGDLRVGQGGGKVQSDVG